MTLKMRCEAALFAVTLFSFSNALWFPQATPWAANQVDAWGWSPKPTAAPPSFGRSPHHRRQDKLHVNTSALTHTCAYEGLRPFTCGSFSGTPYYCTFTTSAFGCCNLYSNGS